MNINTQKIGVEKSEGFGWKKVRVSDGKK